MERRLNRLEAVYQKPDVTEQHRGRLRDWYRTLPDADLEMLEHVGIHLEAGRDPSALGASICERMADLRADFDQFCEVRP